jgi:hypothetical protein
MRTCNQAARSSANIENTAPSTSSEIRQSRPDKTVKVIYKSVKVLKKTATAISKTVKAI